MHCIRVLTLNLWGRQPPFARRMELVVEGIRALAVDVVAFQEVHEASGGVENQAQGLAAALGMQAAFSPATEHEGGVEGLAILSRLPILRHEARELPHATSQERRIVLGVQLAFGDPAGAGQFAGAGELALFTTHLNYRLGDGVKREDQVRAIDEFVAGFASPLPKIVMGDFNATPEHDEIRYLRGRHTLGGKRAVYQDAWERRHGALPGHTWSSRNPQTHRLRWLEIDRRIDYVFVTPMQRDGRGTVRDCRVVFDQTTLDGVYASDHFGVYAEVQIAPDPMPTKG